MIIAKVKENIKLNDFVSTRFHTDYFTYRMMRNPNAFSEVLEIAEEWYVFADDEYLFRYHMSWLDFKDEMEIS